MSSIGRPSTVDGARSDEAVSTMEDDTPPQPPPKTDSGVETPKPESKAEAPTSRSIDHSDVGYTLTKAATDSRPAPAAKENVQPNGIVPEDKPATNGTPATEHQPTADSAAANDEPSDPPSPEEKVAVTAEEPPPIKAAKAMPGMSATSGPLEDFPHGGDMRFD